MPDIDHYEDFYANCDDMPGADRVLRVGGVVVFRTGGYAAELSQHVWDGSPPINPLSLHLDLVVTGPGSGTAVAEVLSPVKVEELVIADPQFEYDEIVFVMVGTEDDPPPPCKVVHARSSGR